MKRLMAFSHFRKIFILLAMITLSLVPLVRGEEYSGKDQTQTEVHFINTDWPISLQASVRIPSPPDQVWKVISNYDQLTEFLPDLKSSRTISRSGNETLIQQATEVRFLFFKKTVTVTLNILEKENRELDFVNVDGDMELFTGKWIIQETDGGKGSRLNYMLSFKPSFYTPKWIARHNLKNEIPVQLKRISDRVGKISPKDLK